MKVKHQKIIKSFIILDKMADDQQNFIQTTNQKMEELLKKNVEEKGITYIPVLKNNVQLIFELFVEGKIPNLIGLNNEEIIEVENYMGLWYERNNIREKAIEHYTISISMGNVTAMNNLAILYAKAGELENAKKYYSMAINKGHTNAMNSLGILYWKTGDLKNAKKYYLMAINKGDTNAMFNLANLYDDAGELENAKKYYLMAIDKGDTEAMNNLGGLYYNAGELENAKKYYLMASEKGQITAMYNLGFLYATIGELETAKKYYLMAIDKGNEFAFEKLHEIYVKEYVTTMGKININTNADCFQQFLDFISIDKFKDKLCPVFQILRNIYKEGIEAIDLHIKYSPGEKGAEDAKKDFIKRMQLQI